MKPNIVKFTGRFKDLIPHGWTFQKLFANNYRQYHKTGDGSKWGQECRIWQHHGGYLEIGDLYSNSALIVKQIEDGKIAEWESYFTFGGETTGPHYWLYLDKQERRFFNRKDKDHIAARNAIYDGKVAEEDVRAYYDRYREFNLSSKIVSLLEDLISKGWIKSAYDPKFEKKS